MKGIVKQINRSRGMVAVLTEEGSYSIFEILGGAPIEIDDRVSWVDDTVLGSWSLVNHSQQEQYEVYFQNHHVPSTQLRAQLLIN